MEGSVFSFGLQDSSTANVYRAPVIYQTLLSYEVSPRWLMESSQEHCGLPIPEMGKSRLKRGRACHRPLRSRGGIQVLV